MVTDNLKKNRGNRGQGTSIPLPAVNDVEGIFLPDGLPPVIDAHVHLFPDRLFASVWQWFEQFGWPVRYQLPAAEIAGFLLSRGVRHVVALQYAHKTGVAEKLNAFMATICADNPNVTGMATVYPGEPDAAGILKRAFDMGLSGVKLHSHVQCFPMDGARMEPVYTTCVRRQKPLIMHVGREPKSESYPCDPYELCRADVLEEVLRSFPDLKVCVPHLGADEFDAYRRLIEQYDNLWLDTTMTLADYLPMAEPPDLKDMRTERIMFGTDFPNIPYAWDREVKKLAAGGLVRSQLDDILWRSAVRFYGIPETDVFPMGRTTR